MIEVPDVLANVLTYHGGSMQASTGLSTASEKLLLKLANQLAEKISVQSVLLAEY